MVIRENNLIRLSIVVAILKAIVIGLVLWALCQLVLFVWDLKTESDVLRQKVQYLEVRVGLNEGLYADSTIVKQWLVENKLHQSYQNSFAVSKQSRLKSKIVNYILTTRPGKIQYAEAVKIVSAAFSCSAEQGVDPRTVIAMIHQESWFDKTAIGPEGERGLMQLTQPVAKKFGVPWDSAFDISLNVCAGVKYFAEHRRRYNNRERALVRYNGSIEYVHAWSRRFLSLQQFLSREG